MRTSRFVKVPRKPSGRGFSSHRRANLGCHCVLGWRIKKDSVVDGSCCGSEVSLTSEYLLCFEVAISIETKL